MAVNPQTWESMDLPDNPAQWKVFMRQLVSYLQSISTATSLISTINSSGALTAGAFLTNTAALGTQSSSFTFNCQGALVSAFSFTMGAALTLTLSNFPIGGLVFMTVDYPATRLLKMAATTPTGTAFTAITLNYATGGANSVNMITTGFSDSTGNAIVMMCGAAITGPALNLIGQ